jgi:hypothetical protein
MSHVSLTEELARALGLPKFTRRAVLTLEAGVPPVMQLELYVVDSAGRLIVEPAPGQVEGTAAERLAQVQFMVRLERFPDADQAAA